MGQVAQTSEFGGDVVGAVVERGQAELPRRFQASTAQFLLFVLKNDAEAAIPAGRTYQADLHGTADKPLEFERHIAEDGGKIRANRLAGERRQPGVQVDGAGGQLFVGDGGAVRQVQFHLQHRTVGPDVGAAQDPDALKLHVDSY